MPNASKKKKTKIKTVVRTACALALLGITPAHAMQQIRTHIPTAEKVGEGRLTYMLWDIYDATLYAPQGQWTQERPFALKLSYLREIEGKKIADRSVQEMREQGINDELKLATWHAQMQKIFPNVDEGTNLTGVYTDTGHTIFYKDDKEIGRIKDKKFSQAFFGIWLGEQTNAPNLRQKLLGAS